MSYIAVPAERAAKLVSAYMAARDAYIAEQREPLIQRAMRHTWWQRLRGKPPRTRAQAIEYLKAGDPFGEYRLLGLVDLGTVCHIDGIQHATGQENVWIRSDIFKRLLNYEGADS